MSDPLITYPDGTPFPGVVGETLADSTPAWPVGPRAADGAPNVVLIVLDDVGFAQLGCFGSDIDTPHIDALAAGGARYRQFHTTAMCSPTRTCLLTGRNHHTAAMGGITDLAMGFPGFNGRIPKSCGFVSEVLRQNGYSTFAVGKWHLAPSEELHAGAPRDRWPLGQGFERFYGFLGAETNQFAPDITIDNTIQRPMEHREGYHLSEDLVDRAIEMVDDLRNGEPAKPFFMYLAFGACHSPHQAPPSYIEGYRGRFDQGWDAWREQTHRRQIELGVVPEGTELSARPDWVQEWDVLPDREKLTFARMMEVFAAMLTHTDDQIGRLVEFLRETGEIDNTMIVVCSDNGASAEGGPFGTFNENFMFNGLPHDADGTFAKLGLLGGPDSHGHYPWGWTMAGNTPYKRWKRETHEGGVGDPLVVHFPKVLPPDAAGVVRDQYVHATDIGATILDVAGVAMPEVLNGIAQDPVAGRSIAASLADPTAAGRSTQYYEQFACRAIYHEGWKAVTHHPFMRYLPTDDIDKPFSEDRWELYHVAEDPSEIRDLADAEPERLQALIDLWYDQARTYGALPLQARRSIMGNGPGGALDTRLELRQGAAAVPEANMPRLHRRPLRVVCDLTLDEDGEGVLVAHGGRFGGTSLFVQDGYVRYAYNFLGLETTAVSTPLAAGRHLVTVEQIPGEGLSSTIALLVDGETKDAATVARTVPVRFTLAGEGICCGYDDGTPVVDSYPSGFDFTGTIHRAFIDVSGTPTIDLQGEIDAAWQSQ